MKANQEQDKKAPGTFNHRSFCLPVHTGVYKHVAGNRISGPAGHGAAKARDLSYYGRIGKRGSVVHTSALALQYDPYLDKEDRKGTSP